MPDEIPPDLLQEFQREFTTRWSAFLAGGTVRFKRLTLQRAYQQKIIVSCYSDKYHSQNLSEDEARQGIAVAKREADQLIAAFPEIREAFSRATVEFEFYYDDGKGSFLVAKESDGRFESYIQKA